MITREQYEHYKRLVDEFEQAEYEDKQREADEDVDAEPGYKCPTCGEIDGMENPCCPDYDPLHIDNCGYG